MARSAVYGLLARAFAYPAAAHRDVIAEIGARATELPEDVRAAVVALASELPPVAMLEAGFTRLFTHSASRDCPPFETAYTAAEIFQQAQQMADIGGFYAAFGVASAPGAERPDHICVELEFMQYLTAKEAYAASHLGAARVGQCRRAQRLFLQDHLACWAPAFGRRLATLDPEGWHGRAGRLLDAWLAQECRALRVAPTSVIDAPVAAWPAPDPGDVCGLEETLEAESCQGCPFDAGDTGADGLPAGALPLPLLNL